MVKYAEIISEWNKGHIGVPLDDDYLETLVSEPPIGQIMSNIKIYYNDSYGTVCFYILKEDTNIIGYMWLEYITDDIWQIKGIHIKTPKKGIGTELYHFIVKFGGVKNSIKLPTKKLINDSQLSSSAEKLWLSSLPKTGITMKIYDKHLNKIYDLSEIGKLTDDHISIIHPKDDIVDTIQDYDNSTMRFFLLAESTNQNKDISEKNKNWLDIHQRFLNGEKPSQLVEEVIKHKFSPNLLFGGKSWI